MLLFLFTFYAIRYMNGDQSPECKEGRPDSNNTIGSKLVNGERKAEPSFSRSIDNCQP